jgi:hypothetical protein
MSTFLDKGRLIANVTADDLSRREWADQITVTMDETSRALTATRREAGETWFEYYKCMKFALLFGMIQKDIQAGKRVVVYTSFRSTFDHLSVFFSSRGLVHLKLNAFDPADVLQRVQGMFADFRQPYNVLLLDPLLTEGINLEAAKTLHVLEPISNWGQQQQVYARVLRQLPQPAASDQLRPISTVVQWVDTLPTVSTVVQRTTDFAFGGALTKAGMTPQDVAAWAFGSRAAMFLQQDKSDFAALTETQYPNTATPGQLTLDNIREIALVMNKLQEQLAQTKTGMHLGDTVEVATNQVGRRKLLVPVGTQGKLLKDNGNELYDVEFTVTKDLSDQSALEEPQVIVLKNVPVRALKISKPGGICTVYPPRNCSIWMNYEDPGTCRGQPAPVCNPLGGGGLVGGYVTNAFFGMRALE